MRQDHKGGEKLFVDYGEGLSLIDPQTGDLIKTELFVTVWGTSTYTFAEASLTQQLPDWIGSHVRAFKYFGCYAISSNRTVRLFVLFDQPYALSLPQNSY